MPRLVVDLEGASEADVVRLSTVVLLVARFMMPDDTNVVISEEADEEDFVEVAP